MKRLLCVLLSVLMAVVSSGCWNRREPKNLAVINSVLYDEDEDGSFQVIAEIMNPSAPGQIQKGSSDGYAENASVTGMGEGPTLPEAIRNMTESIEKIVFGGHNKVRFFSERLVKNGVAHALSYFLRDVLTDETSFMVVIKDQQPERVYSCMSGLTNMTGDYIQNLSRTQPGITSKSVFVTTLEFVKDYYDTGKQPVAGLITLEECDAKPQDKNHAALEGSKQGDAVDEDKKYKIIYEGLAVFKEDRLAGYMNDIEARAYNIITNGLNTAVISVPIKDDYVTGLLDQAKTSIDTKIEGDQVSINIKTKAEFFVIQDAANIDVSKIGAGKELEQALNALLENEMMMTIDKARGEFNSDIFGFGSKMHVQNPKAWKEMRENWDDILSNAQIDIEVKAQVTRMGEIKRPFEMEGEHE